jgi:hypothetical protein
VDIADAAVGFGDFSAKQGIVAALSGQTIVKREHVLQKRRRFLRQYRLNGDHDFLARVVDQRERRRRGDAVRCKLLKNVVQGFQGKRGNIFRFFRCLAALLVRI